MKKLAKLKKRYAALLGRYPRGRYASDTQWLEGEIKRMDQTLKMLIRGHITHAHKRINPVPLLMKEARKYGLHPDEHEMWLRAARFYRLLKNPRRVRKPSVAPVFPRDKNRKIDVTFRNCHCNEDCAKGHTCSSQKVCVEIKSR